jgi:putative transposase
MNERNYYRWRSLTEQQRRDLVALRRQQKLPWHSVPHRVGDTDYYMVTAACYDHKPIIGYSPQRMSEFESNLLEIAHENHATLFAWVVLPNHYHLLAHSVDITTLLEQLGQLHGRSSYQWNGKEDRRGRTVWCNAAETAMKSERHFYASLNYVLNNAVRHGYVERWQDWPYCNADAYLNEIGHEEAKRRWLEYPVLNFGDDWDPPEL